MTKPKAGHVEDRKRAGTLGAAKSPWSNWNRQFASGNRRFVPAPGKRGDKQK